MTKKASVPLKTCPANRPLRNLGRSVQRDALGISLGNNKGISCSNKVRPSPSLPPSSVPPSRQKAYTTSLKLPIVRLKKVWAEHTERCVLCPTMFGKRERETEKRYKKQETRKGIHGHWIIVVKGRDAETGARAELGSKHLG